jgi:hypothetical protein
VAYQYVADAMPLVVSPSNAASPLAYSKRQKAGISARARIGPATY